MRSALILTALLTACSKPAPIEQSNRAAAPAVAPMAKPVAPPAKAFVLDQKDDLIDFHFAWSAEAAAVPDLVKRFTEQMTKAKAELIAGARTEKAWREKEKLDFNGFESSTDYATAGQSARLLSLSVQAGSYTGGAHPNHGTTALLWDRGAGREIKPADLFADPANRDRLIVQRWCDALNRAREEKRGEPVGGNGMFDDCPKLDDIAFVPTDKDGDGKFERLILTASPYVAGPYAEGEYEVELAVTPDLLAGLKSDYRESFAVGQPQ